MAAASTETVGAEGGLIIRRLLQVIFITVLWAVVLFLSAGRLDWPDAWVYLAAYLAIIAVNAVAILSRAPELVAERAKMRKDAKSWDKLLAPTVALFGPLFFLAVAGLDERFGWSPELGLPVKAAAIVLVITAYGFSGWAMASNKFFSGLVAIQRDRDHKVVSSGPYSIMRHPGYVGIGLAYLATPLVLGSLLAMMPAVLTVAILVLRTALEDQTLQDELPGYREYAGRVRYRLLPGVW